MDSKYLNESEREYIRAIFNKYDKNRSGLLEKEELINSFPELLELMDDHKTDEEIKTIAEDGIKQFDFNHNGALEYEEFIELMSFLILERGLSFDYR